MHNSSASNLEYMEEYVWSRLKDLNMNTVVAPIYWETIEPEKDIYDFNLLDGLIIQARNNNMHLTLLWFGLWEHAFGLHASEYFMAYHFAKAIETITSAGQNKYPLPCYTNAWLKQHPWYPGSYPCGGPIKEVHRI